VVKGFTQKFGTDCTALVVKLATVRALTSVGNLIRTPYGIVCAANVLDISSISCAGFHFIWIIVVHGEHPLDKISNAPDLHGVTPRCLSLSMDIKPHISISKTALRNCPSRAWTDISDITFG